MFLVTVITFDFIFRGHDNLPQLDKHMLFPFLNYPGHSTFFEWPTYTTLTSTRLQVCTSHNVGVM